MKVKELITLLENMPQDLEVVTAGDDEGNSFRKIPDDWVSVEKFDENFDIYAEEDYINHSDLIDYVCIG